MSAWRAAMLFLVVTGTGTMPIVHLSKTSYPLVFRMWLPARWQLRDVWSS